MKKRVKFGVSLQWWQFDCENKANLKEEVEILRQLGIEEVRIINPTPPTWQCQSLCTADDAFYAQYKLTSELKTQKISSTFLLANSLSSVTELMRFDEKRNYLQKRDGNEYEATVDIIHDSIIRQDCEVLSLIEKEFKRYYPIYDKCQLINAGELFMFNGRNHYAFGRYNAVESINKFLASYDREGVFCDSANIYLQGEHVNEWMSFARPYFCELKKPLKYVSEFNITDVDNSELRSDLFVIALRKIISDWNPEVICFHTLFGGWFVLQERGIVHKLWSQNGIKELQGDLTLKPFNDANPVVTQMNGILYSGFNLKEVITEARR